MLLMRILSEFYRERISSNHLAEQVQPVLFALHVRVINQRDSDVYLLNSLKSFYYEVAIVHSKPSPDLAETSYVLRGFLLFEKSEFVLDFGFHFLPLPHEGRLFVDLAFYFLYASFNVSRLPAEHV